MITVWDDVGGAALHNFGCLSKVSSVFFSGLSRAGSSSSKGLSLETGRDE